MSELTWVESGGGPLPAAPASQLAHWGGATNDWDEELTWDADGSVVLIHSARPGATPEPGDHLRIDLPSGRFRVRAAYREEGHTWMVLVQLRPAPPR